MKVYRYFYQQLFLIICIGNGFVSLAQPSTEFGKGTGEYGELYDALKNMLIERKMVRTIGEKERTIYVPWLRDQVHVMKAMKYLEKDISSFVELFLERQTRDGLFYDYIKPLDANQIHRVNLFDKRYWNIYVDDQIQMHRLPVEADVEYLAVEGVYYIWQSTGDEDFLKKWIPSLEKGMHYAMSDPLRWSEKYQLVKRGYTLDTWDFLHLWPNRKEYQLTGGDIQEGIFDVDSKTPMGIMYGDNSGMYAACRQLSKLFLAIGNEVKAKIWDHQAELFRLRTNDLCWNGRFYSHFIEDDPQPDYYNMDQKNTLSLSNPYSINRGLPNQNMSRSIIETYIKLKSETKDESFAEWFGIYPAVQPHFSDYEPGSYVNGGVNTIVAGELALAAFENGYEKYGVDILNRIQELIRKHDGDLPVAYRPDGTVDRGIPSNWGQAAVLNAMVKGLAGVVDLGKLFEDVIISPRWLAAGKNEAQINVAYGSSGKFVKYDYIHNVINQQIDLKLSGNPDQYEIHILLPEKASVSETMVNAIPFDTRIRQIGDSRYVCFENININEPEVVVKYQVE